MIPDYIQKLIDSHKKDQFKLNILKSLKPIKVSKVASFAAGTYETVRNSVELEEEHLLRRRAIRRILVRLNALRDGVSPENSASDLLKEIMWAKYMKKYAIPEAAIGETIQVLKKHQQLISFYFLKYGNKLPNNYAKVLYDIASFEIERIIVPFAVTDTLVNLQYKLLAPLRLMREPNLPAKQENVQTYIAILRTLTKFDDGTIRYYLFKNACPKWSNSKKADIEEIAKRLPKLLTTIEGYLSFEYDNKKYKEFKRQAVPLKVLDKVISNNTGKETDVISSSASRNEEVMFVCNMQYSQLSSKIRSSVVKMMIYLVITKMLVALAIEVPYEMYAYGKIHYLPLSINILFPPILMFIVATSTRIPRSANTRAITEMIDRILDPLSVKYRQQGLVRTRRNPVLYGLFKLTYYTAFLAFIIGTAYVLYTYLHFDYVGIAIFIVFLCLISFASLKIKNTATEFIVVPMGGSIIQPLVDLVAIPVLGVGKRLAEGASHFSPFPFFMDSFVESPYKGIIWFIEEWNDYLRERREEIV